MYRTKRYQEVAGDATILDLALSLHGYFSGACEGEPKHMADVAEVLREVVKGWKPGSPQYAIFDNSCLLVVLAALQEYDSMDAGWKPEVDRDRPCCECGDYYVCTLDVDDDKDDPVWCPKCRVKMMG